jgi:ADP-dependent NAD(P)H-hydrate dehydratase / NAD(P)H-hydrate epimerase
MKILSSQQIRDVDAYTIQHEPIKSIDLMERASLAFVDWFIHRYNRNLSVLVIAGSGNNGGDALAIARLLYDNSYKVKVFLALPESEGSTDYQSNLRKLPAQINVVDSITDNFDLIIDGLFGSGLSRPIEEGDLAQLISLINKTGKKIISIDIASGLSCDGIAIGENIIRPTHSISFQLPKLSFLFSENSSFIGEWHTVKIGLDKKFISNQVTGYNYLTQNEISGLLKERSKFSHKGIFGHSLIIGGSYGKIGAIVLAAKACLRSGAGLVTSLLPTCGYNIMQATVPEVMCLTMGDKHLEIINIDNVNKFSSIGIGPGLGKSQGALALLSNLIKSYKYPMVLDADALNLLAANPELIELLPEGSILTPHIGEFHRLVGRVDNSLERLKELQAFAKKFKLIIVLKGANTSICDLNGEVWFNSTGNPGMATAGSGDVLTGIITSLLSQGYTSLHAAQIGVFLHGKAGDIAKSDLGESSLIASDISERISNAFISIQEKPFLKKHVLCEED